MPLAWRFTKLPRDLDAVISSSHACAKAVRTADGVPHLCYCHTPMRYAWDFHGRARPLPRSAAPRCEGGHGGVSSAGTGGPPRRCDRFVANSTAVADRIRRFYGRDAEVIYPPVDTEFFTPGRGAR